MKGDTNSLTNSDEELKPIPRPILPLKECEYNNVGKPIPLPLFSYFRQQKPRIYKKKRKPFNK